MARVARGELLLIGVEEFEVLLEDEDVFGAVVARERGDDLGLGGVTPIVAMRGRGGAGRAWPATMSRRMRSPVTPVMSLTTSGSWTFIWTNAFCMRWTWRRDTLDQRGAVAQIGAQGDDRVGGAEAAAQQPEDVQVPEPFAVGDIALAAGDVLDVARVDEDHLEAARLEDLEDRDPVDAGGFHRHVGDATRGQPVRQPMEIAGEGRKRLDRGGIAIGGHGDEVFGRPAIDPGGVRMDAGQGVGRWSRRAADDGRSRFMGGSFTLRAASGNRDADEWHSPKRDHAAQTACHQRRTHPADGSRPIQAIVPTPL